MSPDASANLGVEATYKTEVLNRLRDNAALGEQVNTADFFKDTLEAERIGLTEDPQIREFLGIVGEDPIIRSMLYYNLTGSITALNKAELQDRELNLGSVRENLHLASLYKMDQEPENPNYRPFYEFITQTQAQFVPPTETQVEALTPVEQYLQQENILKPAEFYGQLYEAIKDMAVDLPAENLAQLPPYLLLKLMTNGHLKPEQIAALPDNSKALDFGSKADYFELGVELLREAHLSVGDVVRKYSNQSIFGQMNREAELPGLTIDQLEQRAQKLLDEIQGGTEGELDFQKGISKFTALKERFSSSAARAQRKEYANWELDWAIYHIKDVRIVEMSEPRAAPESPDIPSGDIQVPEHLRRGYAPSSPEPAAPPETTTLPEAPVLFGEGSPFVIIRDEGWEEDEKLSEEMKESLEQQRKKDRSGITGEVEFVEYQEKGRSPAGLGRWIPTRSDLAADFANMPIGQWIREPQPDSQLAIKVARGDPQAEGQLAAERWALFNLQTLFEDDDPARPPRILGFGMASVESLERKPRAYLILEKIGPPFENLEDYLKKTGGKLPEKEVLEIAIGLAHILMKAHQRGIMNNDTNDLKLRDSFWDPIGKRLRQIDWGNASNQNVDMGFVQKRSYYHDREGFTRLLLGLLTGDMVSVDAKRITPPPEISQTTREIIERVYLIGKANYGHLSSPEGTAQMYIDLMIAYRQLTGQPIDTARYYQQRLDEQLTRLTLINSYDSVKQNPPTDPALQKIWKEIDFNVRAAENDRMAIEKYGSAIAYVLANTKNGYWSLFDTALNRIYASPTKVNVETLAQPEIPLDNKKIGQ